MRGAKKTCKVALLLNCLLFSSFLNLFFFAILNNFKCKCCNGVLTSHMLLILPSVGDAQPGLDPWKLISGSSMVSQRFASLLRKTYSKKFTKVNTSIDLQKYTLNNFLSAIKIQFFRPSAYFKSAPAPVLSFPIVLTKRPININNTVGMGQAWIVASLTH